MQLPLEFQKNMQALLQEEYYDYLKALEQEHFYGLRVNTAKISVQDFLRISPFELKPIKWCSSGFYYDGKKDRPAKHPYYYAGLYYLQEPSAMLPAEILDIDDNDLILDGCAAPGGKSHQLLSKMSENAFLLSNDISISRCQPLSKNLRLTGRDNYAVISENLIQLAEKMKGVFDKILLDAPCSGEGMFRKDNDLIKSWQGRGNDYYQKIQKELVSGAWKMLKEGGEMVYSTCTFSPQEDEEIIQYMLDNCDDLHLLPIKKCAGFVSGKGYDLENCVKLFPHRIKGEGHFVALMRKGEKRQINNEQKTYDAAVPEELFPFFSLIKRNWYNGKFQTVRVTNHNTGQRDDKIYFIKDT
ncbi:MAG: NOL1/NOP2/sun family putative RNA methylase [Erysipelotrichia bacterium]|nr:NOL1/NOP2/sun family putative RNA methylase [Erysipelotrichia bacterium]